MDATPIELLSMATIRAAEDVSRTEGPLYFDAADLLTRNTVVILDRLNREDFAALPQGVQEQVGALVAMSTQVVPVEAEDLALRSGESDEAFEFRAGILEPIRALQRYLHIPPINKEVEDATTQSRLKFAIQAAAFAFTGILQATQNSPKISREMPYFLRNVQAAAKNVQAHRRDEAWS